jgi:hypothetical protein
LVRVIPDDGIDRNHSDARVPCAIDPPGIHGPPAHYEPDLDMVQE